MGTQGMNCLVRTIVRCYTYLKENTTYRKSITVSTQSGSWTQVYTRTITSTSPPRIFLYMDIISLNLILHIRVICRRLQSLGCGANYRGMWFWWAVKSQWILHSIWALLLALTMESLLLTLLLLISRGIDMLRLVERMQPMWWTCVK